MLTVTRDEAVKLIKSSNKKFLSVEFVKRSDGSLRKMVCQYGIRKYVLGVGAAYDFDAAGLICVWEPALKLKNIPPDKRYRNIPIEGLVKIKINGEEYEVQR